MSEYKSPVWPLLGAIGVYFVAQVTSSIFNRYNNEEQRSQLLKAEKQLEKIVQKAAGSDSILTQQELSQALHSLWYNKVVTTKTKLVAVTDPAPISMHPVYFQTTLMKFKPIVYVTDDPAFKYDNIFDGKQLYPERIIQPERIKAYLARQ